MADVSVDDEHAPNTLLNALIGGVVGLVLSFIPFSTVLGGAVAGYLEGGDSTSGAKVGALAGLVAFVPFILLIAGVLFFVPVITIPGSGPRAPLGFLVFVLLLLVFVAVYIVGFSALGGVLGVYVKENV